MGNASNHSVSERFFLYINVCYCSLAANDDEENNGNNDSENSVTYKATYNKEEWIYSYGHILENTLSHDNSYHNTYFTTFKMWSTSNKCLNMWMLLKKKTDRHEYLSKLHYIFWVPSEKVEITQSRHILKAFFMLISNQESSPMNVNLEY